MPSRKQEIYGGMFLLLGLFLIAAVIFTLGKEKQLFTEQERYYVSFKDVKGLSEGAPVRLAGITIGRVENISFSKNLKDSKIYVTLLINADYLERIREDSIVTIETQGLLGDKFINITAGASIKQILPGSLLKSKEPADISQVLNKTGEIVNNSAQIAQDIQEITKEFKKESFDNLKTTLKNIANITEEIKKGSGILNGIIYNKKGEETLNNINLASKNIAKLSEDIKKKKGLLYSIIYDPKGEKITQYLIKTTKNIGQTSTELSKLLKEVNQGKGLLHHLIYNKPKEDIETIIKNLSIVSKNLKIASDALAKGEGTLGALLMDAGVYNNLVEITDGAKKSILLKTAIKHSLNQASK